MNPFDRIHLGRPAGFVGFDKASLGPGGIRKTPTVVRRDAEKVLKGTQLAAKKVKRAVAPVARVARRVERGARKFFSFL